jgi:hypothetical protein
LAYRRNRGRTVFLNDNKLYEEYFDKKNMRGFRQYTSAEYNEVSQAQKDDVSSQIHIWKAGDRFYKLAFEYYGKSEYWWIIALFNNTPTESHVSRGDDILIPLDYERVIRLYGV